MTYTSGDVLDGRYRLGQMLATGGMSEVYAARDERLERDVAVKVMRLDPHDPAARQRCATESRLLAGLAHPHLVRLYDAVVPAAPADATPYLVMELIDGGTLAGSLTGGPLPPARTRELGGQLAAALDFLHARGIVHRDLKPANVLLDRTGGAKLTDFGIARMVDSAGLTQTGRLLGTAPYLSPEQVRGLPASAASDVYSLGLVLLECVTGHKEYSGTAAEAAVARLTRRPVVPANLRDGLTALLADMTADDPADRPTARAVAALLRGDTPPTGPSLEPTDTLGVPGPLPSLGGLAPTMALSPAAERGPIDPTRAFEPVAPTALLPVATRRRRRTAALAAGLIALSALIALLLTQSFGGAGGSTPGPAQTAMTRPPTTAAATPSTTPTTSVLTTAPSKPVATTVTAVPAAPGPGGTKHGKPPKSGK